MFSEIGNKSLLKTLANALGILDVKQAPSVLETDSVKVVAGLDIGSASLEPITLVLLGPPLIGANDSVSWEIVGDGGGTFVNQGEFYQRRLDRHVIITDINFGVDYDAAGLAADVAAGASANMFMYKSGPLNSPFSFSYYTCGKVEQWYLARAGVENYDFCWPFWSSISRNAAGTPIPGNGPNSIFVQAGSIFNITMARVPIGNWPANTRVIGFCVGFAVPVGCQIPWK